MRDLRGLFLILILCLLTLYPGQGMGQTPVSESAQESSEPMVFQSSPFGLHNVQGEFEEVRNLGVEYVRAIVRWQNVEPRPGRYRFQKGDGIVRKAQDYGINLVVTLRPLSRWGGKRIKEQTRKAPKSGYPRRMDAWLKMVEAIVERYDGDGFHDMPGLRRPIKFWQVENEWLWQWVDTPEAYLTFLQKTSSAIKRADPEARVIAGAIGGLPMAVAEGVGNKDYITVGGTDKGKRKVYVSQYIKTREYREGKRKIELMLREGSRYFDIIDFHSYTEDPYDIAIVLKWLQKKMREYGYSKEIWSLENAGPFFNFSEERFAIDVVRRHVIGFSNGLGRLFWSSLKPTLLWSDNYVRLALIDQYGNKSAAYYTYKLMTHKLHGLESIARISAPIGISAYQAKKKSGQTIYVFWSESGTHTYSFSTTARDVMLTHIITNKEQTNPKVERIEVKNGRVDLTISSPVFLEELM
ncbi:MAG: hypothetical protein D6736_16450 [Nitrospinota bacterium]|nr:MAG: hypothetical protein D6736_16450 [Nitrospinota bacterium]